MRVLKLDPANQEALKCRTLLKAVLTDDGTGCINSEMIQKALTNMMDKAAQRREQLLQEERAQVEANGGIVEVGDDGALVFHETEEQADARKKVLSYVSNLGAYFPHPSNPIYFIRMIEKMKLEPNSAWFPWGSPPTAQLESLLSSLEGDLEQCRPIQETLAALEGTSAV